MVSKRLYKADRCRRVVKNKDYTQCSLLLATQVEFITDDETAAEFLWPSFRRFDEDFKSIDSQRGLRRQSEKGVDRPPPCAEIELFLHIPRDLLSFVKQV